HDLSFLPLTPRRGRVFGRGLLAFALTVSERLRGRQHWSGVRRGRPGVFCAPCVNDARRPFDGHGKCDGRTRLRHGDGLSDGRWKAMLSDEAASGATVAEAGNVDSIADIIQSTVSSLPASGPRSPSCWACCSSQQGRLPADKPNYPLPGGNVCFWRNKSFHL